MVKYVGKYTIHWHGCYGEMTRHQEVVMILIGSTAIRVSNEDGSRKFATEQREVVFLGGSRWKQEIMPSDLYIYIYMDALLLVGANMHTSQFWRWFSIGGMYWFVWRKITVLPPKGSPRCHPMMVWRSTTSVTFMEIGCILLGILKNTHCISVLTIKKSNEHVSLLMLLQSWSANPTLQSQSIPGWWFHSFYFHPYLGLTNTFQMGWNHQLDTLHAHVIPRCSQCPTLTTSTFAATTTTCTTRNSDGGAFSWQADITDDVEYEHPIESEQIK